MVMSELKTWNAIHNAFTRRDEAPTRHENSTRVENGFPYGGGGPVELRRDHTKHVLHE